jgi:hypothetical protein
MTALFSASESRTFMKAETLPPAKAQITGSRRRFSVNGKSANFVANSVSLAFGYHMSSGIESIFE